MNDAVKSRTSWRGLYWGQRSRRYEYTRVLHGASTEAVVTRSLAQSGILEPLPRSGPTRAAVGCTVEPGCIKVAQPLLAAATMVAANTPTILTA